MKTNDTACARVLEALTTGPATTREIAETINMEAKEVSNALVWLRRTGKIVEHEQVKRVVKYGNKFREVKVWSYRVRDTKDGTLVRRTRLTPTLSVAPTSTSARDRLRATAAAERGPVKTAKPTTKKKASPVPVATLTAEPFATSTAEPSTLRECFAFEKRGVIAKDIPPEVRAALATYAAGLEDLDLATFGITA